MQDKKIFDQLRAILSNYNLSESDISNISSSFDVLNLKKGDFFIKKGNFCDKIGILINGFLIAKYERDNHKKSEKEIVTSRFYFMPKLPRNPIVCDFNSFYNGTKSNENIKAEENSQLFIINKDKLDNLYNSIPEMNKLGRIFAEQSYINALDRAHVLQLRNEDKIKYFNQEFSVLNGIAKNTDIASYLGMERTVYYKLLNSKK